MTSIMDILLWFTLDLESTISAKSIPKIRFLKMAGKRELSDSKCEHDDQLRFSDT